MLVCASCGKRLHESGICTKCGEIYCYSHKECPRCNIPLEKVTVTYEQKFKQKIYWIKNKNFKIGVSNYTFLPKHIKTVFNKTIIPDNIDIILFPSKALSIKFMDNYGKKYNLITGSDQLPEDINSRYSIIINPKENNIILLNLSVIDYTDFPFLIDYLLELTKNKDYLKDIDTSILKQLVINSYIEYYKKFSLPFNSINEEKINAYNAIVTNTIANYAEYLALKKVYTKNNLFIISDFLNNKIENIFNQIQKIDLYRFVDILSLIGFFYSIIFIRKYSNEFSETITSELTRIINNKHKYVLKIFSNKSDINELLNKLISNELNKVNSIQTYSEEMARIFLESIELLDSSYNLPSEALELFKITMQYVNKINEGDIFCSIYPFGTIHNFNTFLSNNYKNEKNHPFFRVACGQMYSEINMDYLLIMKDDLNYLKILGEFVYIGNLMLEKMNIIDKEYEIFKLPNPIKYFDALNMFLISSQISSMYDNEIYEEDLLNKSLEIAEKYEMKSQKIMILWKKYLKSHDIEYIKIIYHFYQAVLDELNEAELYHIKCVGYISKMILEPKTENHYRNALYSADKIFELEISAPERGQRSSFLYWSFVKMLHYVLISQSKFKFIEKSEKYAYSILQESAPK